MMQPTALADSDTVLEDGSVTIDVLANDSDLDGTLVPATVQITGTASAGDTLIVAGQGSWSVNAADRCDHLYTADKLHRPGLRHHLYG